jgi:hypothetical protein
MRSSTPNKAAQKWRARSSALKWGSVAMVAGSLLLVLAWLAWSHYRASRGMTVVREGDRASETTVDPPIFPSGEIPIMRFPRVADSVEAVPELEKVTPVKPREISVALTMEALPDRAILVRERDPLLPGFRSPGDQVDVEVLCLREDGDCPPSKIATAVPPRPTVAWEPEGKAGAGVYTSAEAPERGFYVGANLLRIGPAKLGASLRETKGHVPELAGLPVELAPDVSVRLVENVQLTGSYVWQEGEAMLGVSVTR